MAITANMFSQASIYNDDDYCSKMYKNNIGHRSFTDRFCYPIIDAVYTWVNGSDMEWRKEMEHYYRFSKNETAFKLSDSEDAFINQYRDNDELKYSLRSLEKNAPWIHKVFIVTNGQVPSWLDIHHPKLEIVTHKQIFKNISYLPTFSSAAIEMNLHRIPGLSDNFIYFNDDIFLGQFVNPYDFYTLEQGQIMYYSWKMPSCSNSMLGDGVCNEECYTARCGYDLGDCKAHDIKIVETENTIKPITSNRQVGTKERCNAGCPFLWIGDGSCDKNCNVEECGFDAYDCNTSESYHLKTTFVHFVRVKPVDEYHPVFSYLHSLFPEQTILFEEETTLYFSRVVVDATGSYVSLQLTDLNRIGYSINTIEIINDENVYSSIYHSFFHELIIVWTVPARQKGNSFSVNIIIHANKEGRMKDIYLELIRIPVNLIPPSSPLIRFMYDANDRNIDDNTILVSNNQDMDVCNSIPEIEEATDIVMFNDATYFVNTVENKTKQWVDKTTVDASLPSISSKTYKGDIHTIENTNSRFELHKRLTIGNQDEIDKAIKDAKLDHHYRRICYNAFKERAEITNDIRTDKVIVKTIPYFIKAPLFSSPQAYNSRILEKKDNLTSYSSYSELYNCIIKNEQQLYYTQPIERDIICQINTTYFEENSYYQNLMQNKTEKIEGKVLRINDGIENLRYIISLIDRPIMHDIYINMKKEDVLSHINELCDINQSIKALISQHPEEIDLTAASVHEVLSSMNITSSEQVEDFMLNSTNKARRLNAFDDSIMSTNLLYIQLFGKDDRYVPAHMPHFMNKTVLMKIENDLKKETEATMSHRFRQSNDLQYAFMYYYYLENEEKKQAEKYYDSLWSQYIDTNHDGVLNDNEFRTLAALLYSDNVNDENMQALLDCVTPAEEETKTYSTNKYMYTTTTKKRPLITFERYKACAMAVKSVQDHFPFKPRFTTVKDTIASFETITDDEEEVQKQLNNIRRKQSKFICINDNVKNMTESISKQLHEFYESFFPTPSQFERVSGTQQHALRLVEEHYKPTNFYIYLIALCIIGIIVVRVL